MNGGRVFQPPCSGANKADDLPLLVNWRLVAGVKLVGEVTGHPELADGWMLTSRLICAPDPARRMARCVSRSYRLGEPWPADRDLPADALQMVVRGILQNLLPEDRNLARDAATALARAALRPGEDPFSGFSADGDVPPDDRDDPDSRSMARRRERLSEFARMYAIGEVEWRRIADETSASFGDLLQELGRQSLSMPVVAAPRTPGQQAFLELLLHRAAAEAKKEGGDER